ncbi:hypothetical protein SAMN04488522_104848 [Pedobacter caeni]|uniref:Uncharacterized protein n=1 Tax=Pedobacter caeni TaxID=288992 RepID=A0A1M5HWG9_9SPHI|nr:hypothetical protein SAMN04488522_104848 [Pedobacter caeni]
MSPHNCNEKIKQKELRETMKGCAYVCIDNFKRMRNFLAGGNQTLKLEEHMRYLDVLTSEYIHILISELYKSSKDH